MCNTVGGQQPFISFHAMNICRGYGTSVCIDCTVQNHSHKARSAVWLEIHFWKLSQNQSTVLSILSNWKEKKSWEPPLKLKSFSVHIISPQTKYTAHQHLFYPRRSSFPVTMKEGEYSAGWGWNWETDLGAGALVFPEWFKIPVESHKVNKSIYQLQ